MAQGYLESSLAYRDLKGLAGFAIDLIKIARMEFRNPHGLTKFLALDSLRRRTGADTFIEAGTHLGTTAARCSRVFKRVFTVEIDPETALRSTRFLMRYPNVTVIVGDAQRAIPRIIEAHVLDRILVFLDAHAALGNPIDGVSPEPAVDVLDMLSAYRHRIFGIVVDDFRNFGAAPGFPPRSCLVKAAEDFCSDGAFVFDVHLDQLLIRRIPC